LKPWQEFQGRQLADRIAALDELVNILVRNRRGGRIEGTLLAAAKWADIRESAAHRAPARSAS
jgi:hypothetical protein